MQLKNYAIIFKAYDIRGKYPIEINEKIVYEIISSFISKIKNQRSKIKVVVARDARLSSPALYRAAINSIKYHPPVGGSSIKIIKVGLATTPMLYFLVNKLKADFGIMITASHNPKEYNGLKIVGKNAVPISGNEIYKNLR
ncbi:MAG: hypothetical protein AAB607_01570 [Patescibacteria group bacterium]